MMIMIMTAYQDFKLRKQYYVFAKYDLSFVVISGPLNGKWYTGFLWCTAHFLLIRVSHLLSPQEVRDCFLYTVEAN